MNISIVTYRINLITSLNMRQSWPQFKLQNLKKQRKYDWDSILGPH